MAKDKDKKKKKHHDDDDRRRDRNNDNRHDGPKVPRDVEKFVNMSFKKYKKENKYALEQCESKKEKKKMLKRLRIRYIDDMIEFLPAAIKFAVTKAGVKEFADIIEEIKNKVYEGDFVKYMIDLMEDKADIDNVDMLPIMYRQFLIKAHEVNADVTSEVKVDIEDVEELIKLLIKKKFKKLVERGVPEKQAFDYVTILPTPEVFREKGQSRYYVNTLLACMYDHARTEEVQFDDIMTVLFKIKGKDDDNKSKDLEISSVILQLLLEKKAIITDFTDSQKTLYNNITTWALNALEGRYKREEIKNLLLSYIRIRTNDERNHRDGNRRVYLSTLSAEEYPKIAAVVNELSNNAENKKYF